MELIFRCTFNPNLALRLWSPPGHEKLLIALDGKYPQDGIPYDLIPDLQEALRLLVEKHATVFTPYRSRWEEAMSAVKGEQLTPQNFVPYLVGKSYAAMLVMAPVCSHCKKTMTSGAFPVWYDAKFEQQVKRAGWNIASGIKSDVDGGEICKQCADSGIAKFECYLCHEERPYSQKQYQYGEPPDYLCTVCFETVTAKEWDEAENELLEEHKYDFR